jgi:hypothetical protein
LLIHLLPEILAALLFIEVIRGYRQRRHAVQQRSPGSPRPIEYPSVSVIRPMRGLAVAARREAKWEG